MCFLGWAYELMASFSAFLTPVLQNLGVPNMHLPDAIVMFVVIPFVHLMNDEDTKTIVLNEGWYQGIRHMLGIYIKPPKNLKESSKFYNQRTRQILAPTGQNDEQNVQALSHPITESMTHQNSSSKDNRVLFSRRLSAPLPVTSQGPITARKRLLRRSHSFSAATNKKRSISDGRQTACNAPVLLEGSISIKNMSQSNPIKGAKTSDSLSSIVTIYLEN